MPDPRIAIRLATPSLLFAPFYLAKKWSSAKKIGDFGIFERVHFTYAGVGGGHDGIDDLVKPVLKASKKAATDNACLLAVGDPMRMISGIGRQGLDSPYFLGSLLHKMCYWLVDTVALDREERLSDRFCRIIVHPRGMTGYSLLYYELSMINCLSPQEIAAILAERNPGYEEMWYRALSSCNRGMNAAQRYEVRRNPNVHGQRVDRHVAFLASDPVLGYLLETGEHRSAHFSAVKNYFDEKSNPFQDALMTGMITGRDLYHDNKIRRKQIDEIVNAVESAADILRRDPSLATQSLLLYSDERISFRQKYGQQGRIERALDSLCKRNVYPQNGEFRPLERQIRRSLEIRAAVGLPYEEDKIGEIEGQLTDYFRLREDRAARGAKKGRQNDETRLEVYRHVIRELQSAVSGRSTRVLQLGMGFTLVVALFGLRKFNVLPEGGDRLAWASIFAGMVALVPAVADIYDVVAFASKKREFVNTGLREGFAACCIVTFVIYDAGQNIERAFGGANSGPWHILVVLCALVVAAYSFGWWLAYQRREGGLGRALEGIRSKWGKIRALIGVTQFWTVNGPRMLLRFSSSWCRWLILPEKR